MRWSIIILTVITILLLIAPAEITSDTHEPAVLLVYETENDRTTVENILDTVVLDDIIVNTVATIDLTAEDIEYHDMIIFASSTEFSTDEVIETALLSFLGNQNNSFVMISPYINEFSGDLRDALGVDSIDEVTENSDVEWSITTDTAFGNYSSGKQFDYTGKAAMVTLEEDTTSIASFTSVNDSDLVNDLPRAAIWNTSQQGRVHMIATALDTFTNQESGIWLDQAEDFLTSIVEDVIKISVIQYADQQNKSTETPGDTENNPTTGEEGTQYQEVFPIQPTLPQFSIIATLLALLVLFYSRLVAGIQWIIRKGNGLLLGIVGVFYNIQDRTLSHSEVMINEGRTEIIDYLQHMGSSGAHLREIKTVTEMGSGSLLWHLQVLEDYGYIYKYSVGSYTIFVANSHNFDHNLKVIELKLQSKYTLDLLSYLANTEEKRLTLGEIEQDTGSGRRPLRRLLKKMEDEGLVELEKYPQMSIILADKNKITKLYHNFNLRRTFSFEKDNPQVDYL